MGLNQQITPECIIYANQQRLTIDRDAALEQVKIIDRLNAPSLFFIRFAGTQVCSQMNDDYALGTEYQILMGYKNRLENMITGEVTGLNAHYRQHGCSSVICGKNFLHRLARAKITRSFSNRSNLEIIEQMASRAMIKTSLELEEARYTFLVQKQQTNYEFLFKLCRQQGCHFYMREKTLYIEKSEQVQPDDIILEWGKSLIEFNPVSNTSRIVSEVEVLGWNPLKEEKIIYRTTSHEKKYKGGRVIEANFRGKTATETITNQITEDYKLLRTKADALLLFNNRQYIQGTGKVPGNTKIRTGVVLNIKGLSRKFSGNYLVLQAVHVLTPCSGYITEFLAAQI